MPAQNNLRSWYSWSSPIGLSLFLIGLSVAFLVTTLAIMTLARTGNIGLDMAQRGIQLRDSVRMMDLNADDEIFLDQPVKPMMPTDQSMMQRGY